MKKYIKTISLVLTTIFMLQIIFPIITNIETNISCAVTIPSINDTTATVKTKLSDEVKKLFSGIGRYKFNYTGASSYYIDTNPVHINSNGYSLLGLNGIEEDHDSNHEKNSSGAKLTISEGSSIKKAYLILQYNETTVNEVNKTADWYVTLSYNATKETSNFTPSSSIRFKPEVVMTGSNETEYCNTIAYIEITDFIAQKGTGYYYCSNIPSKKGVKADLAASWKIVVIEQNINNPLKAIELNVCYEFLRNSSSTMKYTRDIEITLPNGIKTKNTSDAKMEILYGISNVDPEKGNNKLQYKIGDGNRISPTVSYNGYTIRSENYATRFIYSINGKPIEQITNYPTTYYLDKNTLTNSASETKFTTIENEFPITGDDAELITNIPITEQASSFSIRVGAKERVIMINTFGIAADIEGFNYTSTQTTTVNSRTQATVTGESRNTTEISNIGIKDGTYVVTLDNKLTANLATAIVHNSDGTTTTITGTINNTNHTVTFSGVDTLTKGTYITYTINCSMQNAYMGITLRNNARYSGYYSNNNEKTSYIEDATVATSSAVVPPMLTVNPNGGTWSNSPNNQTFSMPQGQTKTIPIPTRNGYTFTNWTLVGTGSIMSSLSENNATFTMGSADATLTANWSINTSTLQVNPAGGIWENSSQVQDFTANYNTTKNIPIPTREGHTFTGWVRTGTNGTLSSTTSAATYTYGAANGVKDIITASWRKNTYQLEVKPNGGIWKGNGNNQAIAIEYKGTERIPLPTRNGYTFIGWTLTGTGSTMSSLTDNNATFTMGNANATLTANWRINTSTLQVNPAGGIWENSSQVQDFTANYNTTKNIPIPTREGHTFTGWVRTGANGTLSSTTSAATYTYGATNNVTDIITATWKKNIYELEVRPNGGIWKENGNNQTILIEYKGTENIPLPTRNGYIFTGWTLEGTGSKISSLTEDNAIFTIGAANATLTANWERDTYELEVRPNGGNWNNSEKNQTFSLIYEGTKQIPNPNRNGYQFIGWTLKGEETESKMSSLTQDNATFTMGYAKAILTANWKLITHNITGNIIWNDEENKYISRPSEIEITLNSDEVITEEGALETPTTKTITREQYSFENLQTKKIKDNTDYNYTISQNKIPGYETLVDGYNVTNNLILPNYTSQITITPWDKLETEFVKNEQVIIEGVITASNENRNKVGTCTEEINFQIDSGIEIDEDSIKITYIDKEGNIKEIEDYTIEDNIIKVTFEANRNTDNTSGDSLKIELMGTLQEIKEYTNTISYTGYLRDYETGEDTNINLGILTTDIEKITVEKVSISIKEINEENEITNGSHFEIRRKDTGEIVQSFITKKEVEAIRKLEPMVEYVIVETKPIPGYTTAEEASFIIDEKGEIIIGNGAEKEENTIIIRDYKIRVQIEIKDEITKEYVISPKWQIIRKTEENGEIVEEIIEEWTSEGKEIKIEKLPIGDYTLREISIGEDTGYVTNEDIVFRIQDTKELQILQVEQKVSKVKIHLKDIETEEYVEGAILQIIKRTEQDGTIEEKIIRELSTEKEGNLQLKIPIGEYIIREVKLPENSGYVTIEEVQIEVKDTLEEQQVETKQDFSKIRIEIIDEETKEKIDNVEIEIIDKETNEVVATTKIQEEENNIIKITENKEGYYLERLPIGKYIIKEKTPEGYKEVEDVEMEVEDTAKIQIVKIENKRLIYDIQVEKELKSITIDGNKKIVPTKEMQKVEIPSSKIKTENIILEYTIRVSNVGETKATIGKIIDNIPDGLKLISTDWKQEGKQAIWNAEKEELEPGENKEVTIMLKWENNESNFGEKKNIAKLEGSTNPYNYKDKNTDNDQGEEITIFSVKTGSNENAVIIIKIVSIVLIGCIAIGLMAGIEIILLKRKR